MTARFGKLLVHGSSLLRRLGSNSVARRLLQAGLKLPDLLGREVVLGPQVDAKLGQILGLRHGVAHELVELLDLKVERSGQGHQLGWIGLGEGSPLEVVGGRLRAREGPTTPADTSFPPSESPPASVGASD